MSEEVLEKLAFLLAGWLLAILTQALERRRQRLVKGKRALAGVDKICKRIWVETKIAGPFKEWGIQTLEGMFELDESWTGKLPPRPPEVSGDFSKVLEQVADWEGDQGKYDIYEKLWRLKSGIEESWRIYTAMQNWVKNGDSKAEIPDRALQWYECTIKDIKTSNGQIRSQVDYVRLGLFDRVRRKLRTALGSKNP